VQSGGILEIKKRFWKYNVIIDIIMRSRYGKRLTGIIARLEMNTEGDIIKSSVISILKNTKLGVW